MKFVTAAVIAGLALLAISAGVAGATAAGGSIASALVATPGVQENGSTSFTDNCQNNFEYWTVHLTQGDLLKLTWGTPPAVNRFALWPAGTDDLKNNGCLYSSGWSTWPMTAPLVDDTSGSVQTVAPATGSYPLLFLDTTGANAGAFAFTAVVQHAASVTLPQLSTLPGAGSLTASVMAPDNSPINDSTLKLTLNGYWSNRAHAIATATPSAGIATFSYSLPSSVWGKKIQLQISGGGANASYQPVTSQKETVTVLVPFGSPVGLVTPSALKAASKLLHQPIYWAGPRKGLHYEFWRLTNGNIYVRYLPRGVKPGARSGKYLIVGTYHMTNAFKKLKKFCGSSALAGPHGSVYCALPGDPKSVYVAFPNVNYEIEVYDPSPKVARAIAASGRVAPVR
jgi:hypothetical protein